MWCIVNAGRVPVPDASMAEAFTTHRCALSCGQLSPDACMVRAVATHSRALSCGQLSPYACMARAVTIWYINEGGGMLVGCACRPPGNKWFSSLFADIFCLSSDGKTVPCRQKRAREHVPTLAACTSRKRNFPCTSGYGNVQKRQQKVRFFLKKLLLICKHYKVFGK